MSVPWILAVGHFQLNYPGDGAHLHRAVAPMHHPQAAEGGKLRRGGRLLLAVVAGVAGVSIRGLRPQLPSLSPAETGGASVLYSSVSFG